MAAAYDRFLVLAGGSPFQYSATYDPFTSTDITITNGPAQIGALDLRALRQIRNALKAECPASASANANGDPVWPLIVDGDDFEDWLDSSPSVREDVRYAQPAVQIAGYGSLDQYRKWALQHRPILPRFNVKSTNGSTTVLEREEPFDSESVYIGNKRVFSQDYQDAPYGVAMVWVKDVFKALIPPTVATAGGGTQFSTQPSFAGEFIWNQFKSKDDELGRKGKFVATFKAFLEPMKWYDKPVALIYQRCIATPIRLCEPCGSEVGSGEINVVASSASLPTGEPTSKLVTLKLESCLPCENMAAVTVSYSTNSTVAGYIVESPEYTLYLASAADWATNLATGATVECGAASR